MNLCGARERGKTRRREEGKNREEKERVEEAFRDHYRQINLCRERERGGGVERQKREERREEEKKRQRCSETTRGRLTSPVERMLVLQPRAPGPFDLQMVMISDSGPVRCDVTG